MKWQCIIPFKKPYLKEEYYNRFVLYMQRTWLGNEDGKKA